MPEDEDARKEPLPAPPASLDTEVTLAEAVKQTGVADRTLRRWLDKGVLKGRRTDSPYGVKWLVSLSEVKRLADERGIGSDKERLSHPAHQWRQVLTRPPMTTLSRLPRLAKCWCRKLSGNVSWGKWHRL